MLKNIFRSENVKLKRSFLLYLHLLTLIVYPLLMGLYYGTRKNIVNSSVMIITFYELLALISPLVISIVIGLVFDREEKAGHCKNWLANPGKKGLTIELQLLYYWLLYFLEIIGMSLIYFFILRFAFQINNISFIKILLTSFIFALFGLIQYELAQWIALKFNVGGAMILGFFGVVISGLSITSLFDFIWPVVPWAWQIRLITFWESTISSQVQILTAWEMVIPLILTVVLTCLIIKVFDNWQN